MRGDLKSKLTDLASKLLRGLRKSTLVAFRSQTEAFHQDRMYQKLVIKIISRFHASSFVETGTYLGGTTEFIAAKFPALPVFTCETNNAVFQPAVKRLKKYPNVTVVEQSSNKFIRNAIDTGILGPLPVFFLDAHWYDYWPLQDEVEMITSGLFRCIMIIDDFQVPGREDFVYCIGGGGSPAFSGRTVVDTRVCNLDLIEARLNNHHEYELLYPKYEYRHAFKNRRDHLLIGYVVICQSLSTEFQSLAKVRFIKKQFKAHVCKHNLVLT